ncbi:hypothetical protein RTBOTA2_005275 [Rhodotorula toruloides]|nr:hypothetical protein RTBOTA2_005275 [Rhodotorula toruloides]
MGSSLKSWIALEDKPTKIADMMWWYYAIHPEENERTGIIFGQRVRALVETVFWLQASIPYRGFRKKWGHWDVPDNMIEAHQAASKNFVKKWLESFHEETGLTAYSLLKPTIARRVALMHGTTKARWERDARSF